MELTANEAQVFVDAIRGLLEKEQPLRGMRADAKLYQTLARKRGPLLENGGKLQLEEDEVWVGINNISVYHRTGVDPDGLTLKVKLYGEV